MKLKSAKNAVAAAGAAFFIFALSPSVLAQTPSPDFSFDNFTGSYYLDRDAKGVATLTVQEDMIVQFPASSNLYGITRAVPSTYQGHDLNPKIISLTDLGGSPLPYKTYPDSKGNIIVETGDHAITLSGSQSYRLKYQTTGVAAFYPDRDEFLVDVNGRGWQEPFGKVQALIHVAPSFSANLTSQPSCYIGTPKQNVAGYCTVKKQSSPGDTLITSSTTTSLAAHQALVVKMDFKKGTFEQKKPAGKHLWLELGLAAVMIFVGTRLVVYYKDKKSS